MKRFSELEKKYVCEVIDNEFSTSKNNIFGNKLESEFSKILGVKYSIGHSNGTATMHTALAALGVGQGDEVIVPPLTMSSTSLAVLQNGSIPVYADVDIDSFNILPKDIEKRITSRTKAIITVALYGLSPEYDDILSICRKHNLFLIEDNAECFLSYYKGKMVGTFGDFSSFSFQASKHLTCGEGGMLCTDNISLADNARRFSSLGYAGVSASQGKITRNDIQDPQYNRHVDFGFNYRLSESNSAIVYGQLQRAKELVDIRINVARIFDQVVSNTNLFTRQKSPDYCINSFWSYSLIINTDNPEVQWYKFRNLFQKNGGDGFYAAWKLSYFEPYFLNKVQKMPGVWQLFEEGLCPNAEFLQPRMIQFKTNYWNLDDADKQAEILYKTLKQF